MFKKYIKWLLPLLLVVSSCDFISQKPLEITGSALGTSYSVKIIDPPDGVSDDSLKENIKQVISRVDDIMSVHKEKSEISQFNHSGSSNWFGISEELFGVIEEAMRISHLSQGSFDITMAPIIELWGFGVNYKLQGVPSKKQIKELLQISGFTNLKLDANTSSIKKTIPEMSLNLSAIAKGYAVDAVSGYLNSLEIKAYLVEIGGEVRTKGLKKDDKPWLIAVERPEINKRSIYKIIKLSNKSMATSGDYRNFFQIEGKRYSHTISPSTGYPVDNNIASVSVIHQSCMSADALATALMSMGFQKGFSFAEREKIAVLWILRTDKGLLEKRSSEFDANNHFH